MHKIPCSGFPLLLAIIVSLPKYILVLQKLFFTSAGQSIHQMFRKSSHHFIILSLLSFLLCVRSYSKRKQQSLASSLFPKSVLQNTFYINDIFPMPELKILSISHLFPHHRYRYSLVLFASLSRFCLHGMISL
jgi:hypothetical protein